MGLFGNFETPKSMFRQDFIDYGVLGIDNGGSIIKVFQGRQQYVTINLGSEKALAAYWAGGKIVVQLASGKTRVYFGLYNYFTH